MGFTAVLQHKTRPITVYRQGGVNFLVNEDPDSLRRRFRRGARSERLRLRDPLQASRPTRCSTPCSATAAKRSSTRTTSKAVDAPVVKGIGDCMLYLVDRYGANGSIYDADYAADRRAPTRIRRASA